MYIDDELVGGALVMRLQGKFIGGSDVDLFHGKLHKYVSAGRKSVIIDLANMKQISSVGIGMLISAMATIRNGGGHFQIANISKKIESLLIITKLITVFDAKDSVEEAIAATKIATQRLN